VDQKDNLGNQRGVLPGRNGPFPKLRRTAVTYDHRQRLINSVFGRVHSHVRRAVAELYVCIVKARDAGDGWAELRGIPQCSYLDASAPSTPGQNASSANIGLTVW